VSPPDATTRLAKEIFAQWNYEATVESVVQPLAEAFRIELAREVFGSRLPPALFNVYVATPTFVGPALEAVMDDPEAAFFGSDRLAARATRRRGVERALRTAFESLESRFGARPLAWGRVHTLTFHSPFVQGSGFVARILGRSLNVGPLAMAGSTTTVQAAAWQPDAWFAITHGAGYRQIIDLSDLSSSRYLPPPPGQSEHAGSPFFANLATAAVRGEYFRMLWTRAGIDADASSTLTLRPSTR
jgi:penicillin amidase